MTEVLGLTSPHTRGRDVSRLQGLLKTNWTGSDFLRGRIDGDFGPATGRACIRAKYWLGYSPGSQKPTGGELLLALLSEQQKLKPAYRIRRRARLKKDEKDRLRPLRAKALERAEKDLGMKEHPAGSNRCPISNSWGIQGPWCAMSVSTWYLDAGSRAFRRHRDWAYVPALLQAAELGLNGLSMIVRLASVEPGDIVCFDWDDDGQSDHTGLVRSTVGKTFETIEGNTAQGNDSNGGEVQHRTRDIGDVSRFHGAPAFIRVSR